MAATHPLTSHLNIQHDIYQDAKKTMTKAEKAKVFMNGRSQAVRIPAAYRFTANEVYIRRDPQSGNLILSETPGSWADLYSALDAAGFPDDFLADRAQGLPQQREEL
jgi:antitoxin VapB